MHLLAASFWSTLQWFCGTADKDVFPPELIEISSDEEMFSMSSIWHGVKRGYEFKKIRLHQFSAIQ